jgi:competence protein ComEA
MLSLTSYEKRTVVFVLSFLILGIGLDFFQKKSGRTGLIDYKNLEDKFFDRVDVNRANALEFATIPGVGEKLAYAIVAYRRANGEFRNIEELKKVKGIKDKKLEQIRKYIKLEAQRK